jgi:hypothetical protein
MKRAFTTGFTVDVLVAEFSKDLGGKDYGCLS